MAKTPQNGCFNKTGNLVLLKSFVLIGRKGLTSVVAKIKPFFSYVDQSCYMIFFSGLGSVCFARSADTLWSLRQIGKRNEEAISISALVFRQCTHTALKVISIY